VSDQRDDRDWQPGRGRREYRTPCTHATVFYDRTAAMIEAGEPGVYRCGRGRHATKGYVLDARGHKSSCDTIVKANVTHPVHVPDGYRLLAGSWTVAHRLPPEQPDATGRKPPAQVPGQLGLGLMPPAPKAKRRRGA
jgi:hypothetical protein